MRSLGQFASEDELKEMLKEVGSFRSQTKCRHSKMRI